MERPGSAGINGPLRPNVSFEPMPLEVERGLVMAAKHGDGDAFVAIWQPIEPKIRTRIYFLINDAITTQDLLQITAEKAWSALPRYQDRGKTITPWLLRIARNTTISYLREKRHPTEELQDFYEDRSDWVNPQRQLEMSEKRQAIIDAFGKLEPDKRRAFLLHYIVGMDLASIAEDMGRSLPSVRSLLHRTRLNLRGSLSEFLDLGQNL